MNTFKNCIICGEEFEIGNKSRVRKIKLTRGKNCVTCSRKCSRIYINKRNEWKKQNTTSTNLGKH